MKNGLTKFLDWVDNLWFNTFCGWDNVISEASKEVQRRIITNAGAAPYSVRRIYRKNKPQGASTDRNHNNGIMQFDFHGSKIFRYGVEKALRKAGLQYIICHKGTNRRVFSGNRNAAQ